MSSRGNLEHHGLRWALGKVSFIFYLRTDSHPLGQLLDGTNEDGTPKYVDATTGYLFYSANFNFRMPLATPYYDAVEKKVKFKLKDFVPSYDAVNSRNFTSSQYTVNKTKKRKIHYYDGMQNGLPLSSYSLSSVRFRSILTHLYEPFYDDYRERICIRTQNQKLTAAQLAYWSEFDGYYDFGSNTDDSVVVDSQPTICVYYGLLYVGKDKDNKDVYENLKLILKFNKLAEEYRLTLYDANNVVLDSVSVKLANCYYEFPAPGAFNEDGTKFAFIATGYNELQDGNEYDNLVYECSVSVLKTEDEVTKAINYSVSWLKIKEDVYDMDVTVETTIVPHLYWDTNEASPTYGEYGPNYDELVTWYEYKHFYTDHFKPINVHYSNNVLVTTKIRVNETSDESNYDTVFVGYTSMSFTANTFTELHINGRIIPLSSMDKTHTYTRDSGTDRTEMSHTATGTWNKLMVVNPIHDHAIYINDVMTRSFSVVLARHTDYYKVRSGTKTGTATVISDLKGVLTELGTYNTSFEVSPYV